MNLSDGTSRTETPGILAKVDGFVDGGVKFEVVVSGRKSSRWKWERAMKWLASCAGLAQRLRQEVYSFGKVSRVCKWVSRAHETSLATQHQPSATLHDTSKQHVQRTRSTSRAHLLASLVSIVNNACCDLFQHRSTIRTCNPVGSKKHTRGKTYNMSLNTIFPPVKGANWALLAVLTVTSFPLLVKGARICLDALARRSGTYRCISTISLFAHTFKHSRQTLACSRTTIPLRATPHHLEIPTVP